MRLDLILKLNWVCEAGGNRIFNTSTFSIKRTGSFKSGMEVMAFALKDLRVSNLQPTVIAICDRLTTV